MKMACGRVENCSDQLCLAPAILPQNEYLSERDQFLDYNSNKKRFLWNGNADDLGVFIEDRILSLDEDEDDAQELVISSNSQCAVFKTPLATINFYYSTKTLQVQGKVCSKMRNRLLGVFNLRTHSFQRRQDFLTQRADSFVRFLIWSHITPCFYCQVAVLSWWFCHLCRIMVT